MPTSVAHWLPGEALADVGLAVGIPAAAVLGLAVARGGYYPATWGWATLLAIAFGGVAVTRTQRYEVQGLGLVALGALAGLVALAALTAVRPGQAGRAALEVERGTLYLTVLWVALIVIQRRSLNSATGGVLVGIVLTTLFGLTMYLLHPAENPDAFEGRLLHQPLGYANAMGILAAMGVVLALGRCAHDPRQSIRALSAAALVPLIATLTLSASRGSVAALVVAAAVVLATDPLRSRLVVTSLSVLPLPFVAGLLAVRSGLMDSDAPFRVVVAEGRTLATAIVLLMVAAAAWSFVVHPHGPDRYAKRLTAVVGVVLAVGGVSALATVGSFGDRAAFWRVAWADALAHPIVGSGAGSFKVVWLQGRDVERVALDAHNLYLEMLAELGPLGLALMLTFVAAPLVAGVVARRQPLMPTVLGAYAAFAVHAALDWDWEMPVVVVPALVCAAALIVCSRAQTRQPRSRRPARFAAGAVATLAVLVAVVGLIGNRALAAGIGSARAGDWAGATAHVTTAARWAPWSAEPLLVLGDAQLAHRDVAAARRSYERAAALDRDDWRAWYALARVGDRPTRAVALRRLAVLDPLTPWRLP